MLRRTVAITLDITQLGPAILVVGDQGWVILGGDEFVAQVGVHVTIGHMVDELSNGPAVRAVWSRQLFIGQSSHGCLESGR